MPFTFILFDALLPPRPEAVGESIYLRAWQRMVGGKQQAISYTGAPAHHDFCELGHYKSTAYWPQSSFFATMARAGALPSDLPLAAGWQRRAQVASSFAKWLGTNEGQLYIDQAERLHAILSATNVRPNLHANSYAMAWAQQVSDTDGAIRFNVLAEAPARDDHNRAYDLKATCSYDDVRVLEETACWLGTPIGQEYLRTCRATLASRLVTNQQRSLPALMSGRPQMPRRHRAARVSR